VRRLILSLAGMAALSAAVPVQAQFSESYKFLEAVRKKEGEKVTQALADPAQTVINTRDVTSGESALHIVTNRRDLTWMQFLIAKGANVNARDAKGMTPLVSAVNANFVEGVELLLTKGARLNDSNNAGETPLITAVHNRNIAVMRLLLKAGADPDRADNSGRSAKDYAKLGGGSLLAEIENNAKAKGDDKAKSYGPKF
jgi:ankyrin repeat protein